MNEARKLENLDLNKNPMNLISNREFRVEWLRCKDAARRLADEGWLDVADGLSDPTLIQNVDDCGISRWNYIEYWALYIYLHNRAYGADFLWLGGREHGDKC